MKNKAKILLPNERVAFVYFRIYYELDPPKSCDRRPQSFHRAFTRLVTRSHEYLEDQVHNRFYSKQRRLLRSAVKFSLNLPSQIAPPRPVHARTAITAGLANTLRMRTVISPGKRKPFQQREQKPRNPIKQCCLRERKLTFLFIPFILHCKNQ